jgi:hypothetical protein
MNGDPAPAAGEGAVTYAYRPSLLGAPWEFKLTDRAIEWSSGQKSGRVTWRDIRRVRLSFRPVSMQTHRYVTEIWADGAPKLQIVSSSWKSLVELERLDEAYSAFVIELHRRLAHAGTTARFEQGRHALLYWPGLAVFVVVAFGLAGMIVRSLQFKVVVGAAVVSVFLALFLWQGGNFFARNRPGIYRPEALPPELLPKERAARARPPR